LTITEINHSYFAIYATSDDNDDEVVEIMLRQIQPSATSCSPDYSHIHIPATSYASVSVKTEEESVA
jgi:hypothetical protein